MKNALHSLSYALISHRHLSGFLSRQPDGDISKLATRRADADGEDDEDQPWWKTEDWWGDPLPTPEMAGSTAVIPIKGLISSGYPTMFRAFGYADTDQIAGWVRAAAQDDNVQKIVLSIDSPGGMVTGTPELAEEVYNASLVKPVLAHSKGMMDSAAYWVGSQADAVYCTPSADIGCIGVYQVHYDYTGWLKNMGIRAEMFRSGDLKGAGHPDVPMTDDQRAHLQSEIETIGAQFQAAVKLKRTLVEDDSMQGQSFIGTEAAARNLVADLLPLEALL